MVADGQKASPDCRKSGAEEAVAMLALGYKAAEPEKSRNFFEGASTDAGENYISSSFSR